MREAIHGVTGIMLVVWFIAITATSVFDLAPPEITLKESFIAIANILLIGFLFIGTRGND